VNFDSQLKFACLTQKLCIYVEPYLDQEFIAWKTNTTPTHNLRSANNLDLR